MELPHDLARAVENLAFSKPPRDLARATEELSTAYRDGRPLRDLTALHLAAYAVTRMPATYAAVASVLSELSERIPELQPRTLLDLGSGPGTAAFAAAAHFDSIAEFRCVERSNSMRALAQELRSAMDLPASQWPPVEARDLLADDEHVPADLVTLSYALGELPESSLAATIARAWNSCTGAMVMVEPGTPRGFAVIRAAREELLRLGAAMVAPCPHAHSCPMVAPSWCHFRVRVMRSRRHRLAKGADVGWEDESYSYLIVSRAPCELPAARVIAPPHIGKATARVSLCTGGVLTERTITKQELAPRKLKDIAWGNALE